MSEIGSWAQFTVVTWLLYELTMSPFHMGLYGAFRGIAPLCFSLFMGTLADRYDRRRLVLFTQVITTLLAFLQGVLAQTGLIRVWHLYAFGFLSSVTGSLEDPTRRAILPSLVSRSALANAVILNSTILRGALLLGPSLAGIMIGAVGTAYVFYANALSSLLAVSALIPLRLISPSGKKSKNVFQDLKESLSYVVAEKIILALIVMEIFSTFFGLDQTMLAIFALDVLKAGPGGLGLLQSARGIGGIAGSILLLLVGHVRAQGRMLFAAAFLSGLGLLAFGLTESIVPALCLITLVVTSDVIWATARNTILQFRTEESMRGRVMGILNFATRGFNRLGQLETGVLVPLIGARPTILLAGLIVLCTSLVTALKVRDLESFRFESDDASQEKLRRAEE